MASVAFLVAATITTVQADIVWTTGAPGGTSGGALFFDGDEGAGGSANGIEFLQTGITNQVQSGDYTVSYWINASDVDLQQYAVGTTRQALHLGLNNGNAFQGHWGNDAEGATNVAVADDNWFHATFTFDADGGLFTPDGGVQTVTGLHSIFINGTEIVSTPVNADGRSDGPNRPNEQIILGARFGNNGDARDHLTNTSLDDVAFFSSILSDADIADLANGTTDALTLGAGAYYDFEDDQFGTTDAVQAAAGVTAFGNNLTAITANVVPEPSSLAILLGLGVAGLARRKRS